MRIHQWLRKEDTSIVATIHLRRTMFVVFGLGALSMFGLGKPCKADEPSLTSYAQRARQLLTEQANASSDLDLAQSTTALCDLYVLMRHDSRYPESEMLQGDAAKVRRRLLTTSGRLQNKLKRAGILRPAELSPQIDKTLRDVSDQYTTGRIKSLSDLSDDDLMLKASGAGGAADNGWQLIEMIERVVTPDFWDKQGGVGTIQYFAMRRVLVVRATSDVHEQIQDLLMALGR